MKKSMEKFLLKFISYDSLTRMLVIKIEKEQKEANKLYKISVKKSCIDLFYKDSEIFYSISIEKKHKQNKNKRLVRNGRTQ